MKWHCLFSDGAHGKYARWVVTGPEKEHTHQFLSYLNAQPEKSCTPLSVNLGATLGRLKSETSSSERVTVATIVAMTIAPAKAIFEFMLHHAACNLDAISKHLAHEVSFHSPSKDQKTSEPLPDSQQKYPARANPSFSRLHYLQHLRDHVRDNRRVLQILANKTSQDGEYYLSPPQCAEAVNQVEKLRRRCDALMPEVEDTERVVSSAGLRSGRLNGTAD